MRQMTVVSNENEFVDLVPAVLGEIIQNLSEQDNMTFEEAIKTTGRCHSCCLLKHIHPRIRRRRFLKIK